MRRVVVTELGPKRITGRSDFPIAPPFPFSPAVPFPAKLTEQELKQC